MSLKPGNIPGSSHVSSVVENTQNKFEQTGETAPVGTLLNGNKGRSRLEFPSQPEILELVFKCLDLEGQKICRLVCISWCEEASRLMLGSATVSLNFSVRWSTGSQFRELNTHCHGPRLPPPFSQLRVSIGCRGADWDEIRWLTSEFLITKLTLGCIDADGHSNMTQNALSLIKSSCSNLTHLDTQFWQGTKDKELRYLNVSFPQLLALKARALLTFNFETTDFEPIPQDETALASELSFFKTIIYSSPKLVHLILHDIASIPKILMDKDLKQIQNLEIAWNKPDIPILNALSPSISNLNTVGNLTSFSLVQPNPENIMDFNFCSTLQSLNLRFHTLTNKLASSLRFCTGLRSFRLGKLPYGGIDFRQLPMMKSIEISWVELSFIGEEAAVIPALHVEHVIFTFREGSTSRDLEQLHIYNHTSSSRELVINIDPLTAERLLKLKTFRVHLKGCKTHLDFKRLNWIKQVQVVFHCIRPKKMERSYHGNEKC